MVKKEKDKRQTIVQNHNIEKLNTKQQEPYPFIKLKNASVTLSFINHEYINKLIFFNCFKCAV